MKLPIDQIPFYPLSNEAKLGWLGNRALCKVSHDKFMAGTYYDVKFVGNKQPMDYEKSGFFGKKTLTKWSSTHSILAIAKDTSTKSYAIEEFIKYWEVPDVPDLATSYPSAYESMKRRVLHIYEINGLKKYNFQIEDLSRICLRERTILAWAPGGGKTLGALIWAKVRQSLVSDYLKTVLVIAPQDLIPQWIESARKLLGLKLMEVISPYTKLCEGYHICYYEQIEKLLKENRAVDILIVDELTKIKGSVNTQRAEAVRSVKATNILGLTGTPIKNMIKDIHYIFRWLFPYSVYPFKTEKDFIKTFGTFTNDGNLIPEISNPYLLWKYISPNILYRGKDDFGVEVVPKNIHFIETEFTESQLNEYKKVESKGFLADKSALQEIVALHPNNNKIGVAQIIGDRIIEQKKQIVIAVYLQALAIQLKDYFQDDCRLATGLQSPKERAKTIKEFKEGKFPILIAGIEAMNMGHDLHQCRRMLVCEYPWDYTTFEQLIDRVHRINSPKAVDIFLVYTKGSVDEMLINLIKEKEEATKVALRKA